MAEGLEPGYGHGRGHVIYDTCLVMHRTGTVRARGTNNITLTYVQETARTGCGGSSRSYVILCSLGKEPIS